jgi:hypothetical protein
MNTSTPIDDVVNFLEKFADADGIPTVIGTDWEEMNKKFTKEQIKQGFAQYVLKHNILFPFRKIPQEDVTKKFNDLRIANFSDFIMKNPGEVVEKYDDYKYPYSKHGKFVISFGHYHNDISNYYQQRNRYDCGSYTFCSPNEIWYTEELLTEMNWTFWRMENRGISQDKIRGSFRLGSYVATQFKPHVAKTIFDFVLSRTKSKTKTILDISMGWGDRLAGFYTSSATNYLGTDPNPSVYAVYKQQCKDYEKMISGEEPIITIFQKRVKDHFYEAFHCIGKSGKEVICYNAPAEDILDVIRSNKYDCVFTSPPYFATELYDEGGDDWKQSWARYPQYDNWWDKFYKPVITACYESLTETGSMMFNIMDPKVKSGRYKTCDQMVDHILSIGGKFDGQIGMRIKQRPKNIDPSKLKKHLDNTFIENIWCFSKNGFDISYKSATLEGLFGE